jgi:DNA-directed RNA polymerase beta' subunit
MKLEFLDFDKIFNADHVITNPEPVNAKKRFNADGIFSEDIFGKIDMEAVEFSCGCGRTKGRFHEGTPCPDCGEIVALTEPIVRRLGWIELGGYRIVNPIFYGFLQRMVRMGTLNTVLGYDRRITRDGMVKEEESPRTPYDNIGLVEFEERFDEILEYFLENSKVKGREALHSIVVRNRDLVFVDKLPVFSTILRPALIKRNNMIFDEINNLYDSVIMNVNIIKEGAGGAMGVLPSLANVQDFANQIYEKIIENVRGKSGFIRSNMMGS